MTAHDNVLYAGAHGSLGIEIVDVEETCAVGQLFAILRSLKREVELHVRELAWWLVLLFLLRVRGP